MVKSLLTTILSLLCLIPLAAQDAQVTKWNLKSVSAEDVSLITADAAWIVDSKNRYCYTPFMTRQAATATNAELTTTKGLLFTISANTAGNLRLGGSTNSLWMGDQCSIIIPNCKSGWWVSIEYMTSKSTATRTLSAENLTTTLPTTTGKTHTTAVAEVAADGDVVLTVEGGMYFYAITVADSKDALSATTPGSSDSSSPANPDNPQETAHTFDIMQDFSLLPTTLPGNGPRIYVAPDGNDENDGLSPEKPLKSIQLAIDKALEPGTVIILAPGEYRPTDRININDRNGLPNNYNALICPEGRAIINCNHPEHGHSDNPYQGIRLTSSYWYLYHIDITNASDNGLLIERNKPTGGTSADIVAAIGQGHDNVIHACNFYKNGDTGLQMKNLASYNYVINCDAYLNCDTGQGDADGFAPKVSVGTGNYFYGCRAYLNSDDGWDVFYKKDGNFGDNMTVILDNCIAYKNGFLSENEIAPSGNGNGFKCGSDQGAMNVYMNRCLAVMNKAKGFDQNHNSGDIILNNCTGYTLKEIGDKAYSYRIYEAINTTDGHKVELNNCIAINDNEETDKRDSQGIAKASEHGKNGIYGRFQVDATLEGMSINACEFHRARPEFFESLDHTELMLPRLSNDELPEIKFAKPVRERTATYSYKAGSTTQNVSLKASDVIIDKGHAVTTTTYRDLAVRPITFNGSAPDLGAYESAADATNINTTKSDNAPTPRKFIINNKVMIIANGQTFNLNGQSININF